MRGAYVNTGAMARTISLMLITLLLGLCASAARAAVQIPELQSWVTDLSGTLGVDQRQALEQRLQGLEQRSKAQVAVLLVPELEDETVEQLAVRAFAQWRLGRQGQDDGVLLVVAKQSHALRIEVGYGLEGRITDVQAKHIIDERIAPAFRQGDYYTGVLHGIDAIGELIEGHAAPPAPVLASAPATEAERAPPQLGGLVSLVVSLILLAALPSWLGSRFRKLNGFLRALASAVIIGLVSMGIEQLRGTALDMMLIRSGALVFLALLAYGVLYAWVHGSSDVNVGRGSRRSGGSSRPKGGGGRSGGGGASGGW